MDELLFGTEEIRPASYLPVLAVGAGTVELGGGAAHGLRPGSLWTVRSAGAHHGEARDEVALVEIQTVRAATSTARLVEVRQPVAGGLRAFLREQKLPEPGLRVAVAAPDEPWNRLVMALVEEPLLAVVNEPGEADVLIRYREETSGERTWAAVGRDGRRRSPAAGPAGGDPRPARRSPRHRPLPPAPRSRQSGSGEPPQGPRDAAGEALESRSEHFSRREAPEAGAGMAVFREREKPNSRS